MNSMVLGLSGSSNQESEKLPLYSLNLHATHRTSRNDRAQITQQHCPACRQRDAITLKACEFAMNGKQPLTFHHTVVGVESVTQLVLGRASQVSSNQYEKIYHPVSTNIASVVLMFRFTTTQRCGVQGGLEVSKTCSQRVLALHTRATPLASFLLVCQSTLLVFLRPNIASS
jgi:hypothetical protein